MINHANPIVDIQTNMVNAGCINTPKNSKWISNAPQVFPIMNVWNV